MKQENGSTSELDNIIPPEIKHDELYHFITRLSRDEHISTVLEIGSSAGGGSTEAFVTGMAQNPNRPKLFCMEVSQPRFEALRKRYADKTFVSCYNTSSVPLAKFPSAQFVETFYQSQHSGLNQYPLELILGWLNQDIEYVRVTGLDENGIARIRRENNIDTFDMVLIDGSEFTGKAELNEVYGAKWLLLDDINTYKNFENHLQLLKDTSYELLIENRQLRNGYSIFKRKDVVNTNGKVNLPIHFFTIVLNGEPFIRHHINELSKLPFPWHWHIVEGVAELKHDTAWSVALGGQVTAELHNNGLSNDGTSAYLDELACKYPENVTLYRKPVGRLWDGKLEMVQAPLPNISEECLLWQVDVDEYWTTEQICTAREMFLHNPEKTAAFYWCRFFVGPDRAVSTRNCYSQNPAQEWLRTWRYLPGMLWVAHEPPLLAYRVDTNSWRNVALLNPFSHAETEANGLVFQHYAYVLKKQLAFKERYYGYKGAVDSWQQLQKASLPTKLGQYFPWVTDNTEVDGIQDMGVSTLMKALKGDLSTSINQHHKPVILVDGIFFQFRNTGIARVWFNMLTEWSKTSFAASIILLDRAGTAPNIAGIRTRLIQPYDYDSVVEDRAILQLICDEENADLFVSTYYTVPLVTPSVFYGYDMIPENTAFFDLRHPLWQMKHHGIRQAQAYIAISRSTAYDIIRFNPVAAGKITVAYCAVDTDRFYVSTSNEIETFRSKYDINAPFLVFIGDRCGYKNAELLFRTLRQWDNAHNLEVVCVGGNSELEEYFTAMTPKAKIHILQLSDDMLRAAYSGAAALVYPSIYEGFGLPILEAMACGCPVITCHNSSIPEVAGAAALYVGEFKPDELISAIHQVLQPEIRESLINMGYRQVKKFSWFKMAETVKATLKTLIAKGSNNG